MANAKKSVVKKAKLRAVESRAKNTSMENGLSRLKLELAQWKRKYLVAERLRFESLKSVQARAPRNTVDSRLFVAGVAHEFNNILGAAHGFAEWALESGKESDQRKALEAVVVACERSASITGALQSLGQPREERKELVPMGKLIENAVQWLSPQLHSQKLQLVVQWDSKNLSETRVYVDPTQSVDLLVNLLKNSVESLESGLASGSTKGSGLIALEIKATQKWIHVCVRDNGQGVPQGLDEKIFHPFFTTKGVLAATFEGQTPAGQAPLTKSGSRGLGLWLARSFAESMGGALALVRSKHHAGDTFFEWKLPKA